MANDYSTNQFFNFNNYESGNLSRTKIDNATFAYPGKTAPPIYSKNIKGIESPIERGFIRGIIPQAFNEANQLTANYAEPLKVRRCFFQFNPSLILRNVSASSSTLNPLLQDSTQLLQPIPGQASFEFNLLFNREQEVSNKNLSSSTLDVANNEGLFDQNNINQIGVLHDLQVLDSIIGQSITLDALDALSTYYIDTEPLRNSVTVESTTILPNGDTAIVYSDGSTKTTDNDGKEKITTPPTNVNTPFNSEKFKTAANAALGNSAFLSPMPIRIVFSSLFMVEGFVTSSAVAFQKFSKTMVPTVCTVTLNVQAMYFGFARKKSFLSDAILDGKVNSNSDANIAAKLANDNIINAQKLMSYLSFEIKSTFFNALTFQIENDPTTPPTSLAAAVDRTTFRKWVNFERTYKSVGIAGTGEKLGTFGNAGGDTNTHTQYRFNGANASNYGSFNGNSDYAAANPFKMVTLKDEKKLIQKNIKDGIISNLKIQSLNLYIITVPSGETEISILGALKNCASITNSMYSSHIIVGQECVFGADATDKIGVLSTTGYDLFTKTNKRHWTDPDDWESIAGLTQIAFIFEATFSCETAGNTITQTKWAVRSGIDVDNTTTFDYFNVGNEDGNVNTSYTISSPAESIGK